MDELDDVRKVRLTKKLMDEMASRDLAGNRVIWSWGEPDGEGFYSPSATLDLSDNLAEVAAQQERERILAEFRGAEDADHARWTLAGIEMMVDPDD